MKLVETKIYLKFILWFIGVSILPLMVLLLALYRAGQSNRVLALGSLPGSVWVGIFLSLALVLLLSLLATRRLSKNITSPVQASVAELLKVVNLLLKSIQNLSSISQTNNQISQVLTITSQQQQTGLKAGSKSLVEMALALDKIAQKTKVAAQDTAKADILAKEGAAKSEKALASLAAVKNLLTENQKLSQALQEYATQVGDIAKRVEVLADTAKFFSLNMSIEANKAAVSEEFSSLVSQLRELNSISEQAATSIQGLSRNMQRQIEQSKQSAVFEWQETNRSILTVTQTLNFFSKIITSVSDISKNIQVINRETGENYQQADQIKNMINNLTNQAKLLVKQTDDITKVIQNQLVVTRSLNKSSLALNNVTDALDDLVGKK